MNAPILTPLALQNADLLRELRGGAHTTAAGLARALGRDDANVRKTIKTLEGASLIAAPDGETGALPTLTDWGSAALEAIERAEGRGEPPAGARKIPLALIDPNPANPRKFDQLDDVPELEDLGRSIADKGLLQPLLLRPKGDRYEIIDGERRWRAARIGVQKGWLTDDVAFPAEVRDLTDDDAFEIMGVANLQRTDLHWLDEADFYKALADRGRSSAQIERLVGKGARKKRSIQDLIRIAAGLDAESRARAKLKDSDPAHLGVEACKLLVGAVKAKPKVDLPARAACALIELLNLGELEVEDFQYDDAKVVVLPGGPRPSGPLITVGDRGFLKFTTFQSQPAASVELTDDLKGWLTDRGFWTDRDACLITIRAEVLGDLAAGSLAGTGRNATEALNPPEYEDREDPAPATAHSRVGGDPSGLDEALDDNDVEPQTTPAAPDLTPAQALAVLEIAHKIATDPVQTSIGPAAQVAAGYHRDSLTSELVHARLAMFHPSGAMATISLTQTALDWLKARGATADLGEAAWEFSISPDDLLDARTAADPGSDDPALDRYATTWLNAEPPPELPTVEQFEAAMPAPSAHPREGWDPSGFATDQGAPAPADTTEPAAPAPNLPPPDLVAAPVLQRLAAAAREAARLIEQATTRKLKPAEAETVLALLKAAQGDAEAALETPTQAELAVKVAQASVEYLQTLSTLTGPPAGLEAALEDARAEDDTDLADLVRATIAWTEVGA